MEASQTRDLARLNAIVSLLQNASSSPIGDTLVQANQNFEQIEDQIPRNLAEPAMRIIRSMAARAQPTDPLFRDPPKLPRPLTDVELLQLLGISGAVHELCYCCEMVQQASEITWGGSAPVRFYLNSIYHYTSSMFLVDTSKPTHKDLPMGGTVIRALHPMGLADLIKPVKEVLDEPFGNITFGQTILDFRHSHLVHGDFSPERIEYLVRDTHARNPMQMEEFARLVWKLFHRLMILNLQLLSLLAPSQGELGAAVIRYLSSKTNDAE